MEQGNIKATDEESEIGGDKGNRAQNQFWLYKNHHKLHRSKNQTNKQKTVGLKYKDLREIKANTVILQNTR